MDDAGEGDGKSDVIFESLPLMQRLLQAKASGSSGRSGGGVLLPKPIPRREDDIAIVDSVTD
ncbi:hypothetical protein NL316_27720, partial [Klebsiella pneumoniae]|nr:hypothetical protein [Klebsiella pneumoniae]